jgi:hypothetical protein
MSPSSDGNEAGKTNPINPLEIIASIAGECRLLSLTVPKKGGDRLNHMYYEVSFSLRRPKLSKPKLKHVTFLRKCKENHFCGHDIFIEGVFVTQLPSNAKISI